MEKHPCLEELQTNHMSAILPSPNPGITWGEIHRLWSIVLWSLAFWKTQRQRNFRGESVGREESFMLQYSLFPGTPLTPDVIHSACRKVFAPPDQRKRVIFFQIDELVQRLLCSQASMRAAAPEENYPHSWEEGRGRGVRLCPSPEMSCWTRSVLSCTFLVREKMAWCIEDLKYHLEEPLVLRGDSKPSAMFLT